MGLGGDIFDADLVESLRRHAEALGTNWRDISSQAGHDAYHLATHCPSAMIFARCRNGIIHNDEESCDPRDFEAGLNILLHAVVERTNHE